MKKNKDLGFCVGSLTFSTFSCPVGTFVPLLPCPLPSRRERKGRKAGKEGGEEREMKFVCISMCCKIPHYVQFLQIIYFIFRVNSVLSHRLEFTLPPKAMLVPKSCVPKQSQWFLYLRDPINSKLPGSSGKGWLARIPQALCFPYT